MSPLLLGFLAIFYLFDAEDDSVENLLSEKSNSVNSVKELELSSSQPVRSLTSNAQPGNKVRVLAAKSNSAGDTRSDSEISKEVLRDWPNLKKQLGLDGDSKPTVQPRQRLGKERLRDLLEFEDNYGSFNSTRLTFDSVGKLRSIFPNASVPDVSASDPENLQRKVEELVSEYPALFSAKDPDEVRSSKVVCVRELCRVEFERSFAGLPAFDHGFVFSTEKDRILSIQGELNAPSTNVDIPASNPSEDELIAAAKQAFTSVEGDLLTLVSPPVLGLARKGSHDYLGYRFQVESSPDQHYQVTIDARTLKVIDVLNLFSHAQVAATGLTLSGESYSFQAEQSGSNYLMTDQRFPVGFETRVGDKQTNLMTSSSSASSGWDASSVSALKNAETLISYFNSNHGYAAVNENGQDLTILVNWPEKNASASPTTGVFSFGNITIDGVIWNFAGSLDIMAHEITHGVIGSTSGLVYRNESGALNESFSDFFGAVIDNEDWLLGEDLPVTLRNMANPSLPQPAGITTLCGQSWSFNQPSHMSQYVYLPEGGPLLYCDNGGVHVNSGIPNRAMYLLSEGLSAEGTGTSIGRTKAANLVFKTMIQLSPRSDFMDAANTMVAKAISEYGVDSVEYDAVVAAWSQVGLAPAAAEFVSVAQILTSESNWVPYLSPYYSPSLVSSKTDNSYSLYVQLVDANDPSYVSGLNYGPLNSSEYAAYRQPSMLVFEDGSFLMVYKGKTTGKLYTFSSSTGVESELSLGDYSINSITVASDYSSLTFTVEGSGTIYVYTVSSNSIDSYPVTLPSTAEGEEDSPVKLVDSIRFDPTNRFLVFDFLKCDDGPENDCDASDSLDYWSIGVLEVATGNSVFPFPAQSQNINLGFPSFSNKSDRYIVFDLIDTAASTPSGTISGIYIYDIYNGSLFEFIANPDVSTSRNGMWGSPTFSSDDSGIVFNALLDDGAYQYQALLEDYALTSADSKYVSFNPFWGYLNSATPSATVNRRPSITLSSSEIDFGDVVSGQTASGELCGTNAGYFSLIVQDFAQSNTFINWRGQGAFLESTEKFCGDVVLDSSGYSTGLLNTTVSVIHNGLNSPTPVTLKAVFDFDTDSDGVLNYKDTDDDGDGVSDSKDAFPLDAAETVDTDSDGIGNNADTDDDGDGVADSSDAFPFDATESLDTDDDGTGNNADTDDDGDEVLDASDAFPIDASESLDTDGDGIGNNADADDDGDGVADNLDPSPLVNDTIDTDEDGVLDIVDDDDDGDGVNDEDDKFPLDATESSDNDADGLGDNEDTDDDNDGVQDSLDAFQLDSSETKDTDSDGLGNNADTDDDGDEVLDADDAFPLDSTESVDTDADGIGNNTDTDDDGDQVSDDEDAFPLNATEYMDTDADGTGNNADTDDDGDGVSDGSDAFPLISLGGLTDKDGDGYPDDCDDSCVSAGMLADDDDDNDGVEDSNDAFPFDSTETADADSDGVGDNKDAFPNDSSETSDSDGDAVGDNSDAFPLDASESIDTDGDGLGNNADLDNDNDGFTDEEEIADGTNPLSRFSCRTGCLSFDVDENLEAQPLTDGLLVMRHLFGFSGDALISDAVTVGANRESSEAIAKYLAEGDLELDIDGNGKAEPLTDGLLLIRYLYEFSGESLIKGAIGAGATRDTAEEVEAYIKERVPSD
ncbi:M4 family metallopeptidase [Pseudomonadales bacterium]|nr:M4 family metallopeptidase [Pseudomonadales bacterium]